MGSVGAAAGRGVGRGPELHRAKRLRKGIRSLLMDLIGARASCKRGSEASVPRSRPDTPPTASSRLRAVPRAADGVRCPRARVASPRLATGRPSAVFPGVSPRSGSATRHLGSIRRTPAGPLGSALDQFVVQRNHAALSAPAIRGNRLPTVGSLQAEAELGGGYPERCRNLRRTWQGHAAKVLVG